MARLSMREMDAVVEAVCARLAGEMQDDETGDPDVRGRMALERARDKLFDQRDRLTARCSPRSRAGRG